MKNLQELGVGIVYFQPLENFIESHSALINAIEIEPQTLWYGQNAECDLFQDRHERKSADKCSSAT